MARQEQGVLRERVMLTDPDYITYVPNSLDPMALDRSNEHLLVFDGPDSSLMAIWTQAWSEPGTGNINHTVFSRSDDEGVTWTPPKTIAGPKDRNDPALMTSWAFPMVAKSGRIYVLYNQNQGVKGWFRHHTGTMSGMYSEDNGATWSQPQDIPMPKSSYDDPEGKIPGEWIVWQKPTRDLSGGYFVGYTHWLHPAVATLKEVVDWTQIESVVEFMRFVNVDQDPEPRDLEICYSAWGPKALRVPHREYPQLSVAQEPSLVRLPDQRLFCVMRTCTGYIWWSQSADDGKTWCSPRPLLYQDYGLPLMNPVGGAPIYRLADDRYVLFYHNNRGGKAAGGSHDAMPRNPVFVGLGESRPDADQPIWFSPPKLILDTQGIGVDGVKRRLDKDDSGLLALYTSFTNRHGNDVLWYPDTKFFLLGKRITPAFLSDL